MCVCVCVCVSVSVCVFAGRVIGVLVFDASLWLALVQLRMCVRICFLDEDVNKVFFRTMNVLFICTF